MCTERRPHLNASQVTAGMQFSSSLTNLNLPKYEFKIKLQLKPYILLEGRRHFNSQWVGGDLHSTHALAEMIIHFFIIYIFPFGNHNLTPLETFVCNIFT